MTCRRHFPRLPHPRRRHRLSRRHRDRCTLDDLSPGEVVIKVAYSSVNYKDALAGTGKGKILRQLPARSAASTSRATWSRPPIPRSAKATRCCAPAAACRETRDGGYAEYARLEANWTIPLPAGLTLRESMVLGTAGFTAALALFRMERNGQTPDMGPIVVTGATGGVGSLAIDILDARRFRGARDHRQGRPLRLPDRPRRHASASRARTSTGASVRWKPRAGPARSTTSAATCSRGLTRVIQPYGNIASCGIAGGIELQPR